MLSLSYIYYIYIPKQKLLHQTTKRIHLKQCYSFKQIYTEKIVKEEHIINI